MLTRDQQLESGGGSRWKRVRVSRGEREQKSCQHLLVGRSSRTITNIRQINNSLKSILHIVKVQLVFSLEFI